MPPEELKASIEKILHRPADSYKYRFGHVLVAGGSPGMVGAPFLAARAALRIGAGLVTVAGSPEVIDKLEKRIEEIMTFRLGEARGLKAFIKERSISTVIAGPGLEPGAALDILKQVGSDMPLIIDGGALTALQGGLDILKSYCAAVLTPHAGEFQRLIEAPLPSDKTELLKLAASFSDQWGIILVLKGNPTFVIDRQEIYENPTGGPALASAGTGDVLAGMIGGLIGQGLKPFEAAKLGVYLHGSAGELAAKAKTEPGVIASDVIELIPAALKQIS
jgi:ADP-dependent NAD(P)H-hydrate dehydratase / NAD(P)H-hydrate epimerase